MVKALLISNMRDEELRLKLLQKERTLDEVLNMARKKADAVERIKVLDGRLRQQMPKDLSTPDR